MKRYIIKDSMERVLKEAPYSNTKEFEELMSQSDAQIDAIKANELKRRV